MGDSNITITYETLFEILRNEKNRDDLQKLQPTFLADTQVYLKEKENSLNTSQSKLEMFSEEDRQKTLTQIINIKRILKELYQKRERKILNMALNKSRTNANIIDTSSLLDPEKEFYNELVLLLNKYRSSIILSLFEKKVIPQSNPELQEGEEQKTEVKQEEEKDSGENQDEEETKETPTKLVRFLHAVPKFMGKELEVYGPFDEEDVAPLPVEIADLLIKKGRVEELIDD